MTASLAQASATSATPDLDLAADGGRRAASRPDLLRRTTAEAFAAFALVFAGCGAIVADARYDGVLGAVGVSLVFGLIIMVMVYATGHLSGAHINPAVTIAFTLTPPLPAPRRRRVPRGRSWPARSPAR